MDVGLPPSAGTEDDLQDLTGEVPENDKQTHEPTDGEKDQYRQSSVGQVTASDSRPVRPFAEQVAQLGGWTLMPGTAEWATIAIPVPEGVRSIQVTVKQLRTYGKSAVVKLTIRGPKIPGAMREQVYGEGRTVSEAMSVLVRNVVTKITELLAAAGSVPEGESLTRVVELANQAAEQLGLKVVKKSETGANARAILVGRHNGLAVYVSLYQEYVLDSRSPRPGVGTEERRNAVHVVVRPLGGSTTNADSWSGPWGEVVHGIGESLQQWSDKAASSPNVARRWEETAARTPWFSDLTPLGSTEAPEAASGEVQAVLKLALKLGNKALADKARALLASE